MKKKLFVRAMLGLILAFGLMVAGCSKNGSKEEAAQATGTVASQEQIAAEVARQVAEQLAAEKAATEAAAQASEKVAAEAAAAVAQAAEVARQVAEQLAAEKAATEAAAQAVAQSAVTETPAPAQAAAPTIPAYAIGGKGPGGGYVVTVNNGKGKEALLYGEKLWDEVTITVPGDIMDKSTKRLKYNGYSNWRYPLIQEMQLIYANLQKPGIIHINGTIESATVDWNPIVGFPGFKIYYAGGGGTYYSLNFVTGEILTSEEVTELFEAGTVEFLIRDF
jgi:hypothetical protein